MKLALALVTASMWVLLLPSAVTAQTKQAEVTTDLLVPDTIKPSGAHGTVVLEGDIGPDGQAARFSYHPSGGGLWIELVHTSYKSQLSDWIAETLRELGEGG